MKRTRKLTALLLAIVLSVTPGFGSISAASQGVDVQNLPEDVEEAFTDTVEPAESETESPGEELQDVEEGVREEEPEAGDALEESETEGTQEGFWPEDTEEGDQGEEPGTENFNEEVSQAEISGEVTEEESAREEAPEAEKTEGIRKENTTNTETEEETALVNYLVVDEPVVVTPGTQRIMTSIGDGSSEVTSAVLTYQNKKTGKVFHANAADILDDFVLFNMEFSSESQTGTYKLTEIAYTLNGTTTATTFSKMGIDAAFGVNQTVDTQPDDVLLTDEELAELAAATEMDVVTVSGSADSGDIENAMEDAGCDPSAASKMTGVSSRAKGASYKGSNSVVVVLDAGHGGNDGGASQNGIVEKKVNLKIAQYCRDELSEYAGVKVIMTRDSDIALTLAQRAQVAIDNRADVFISLHNNSSTSSGPNGANVYYPNNNYNSSVGSKGRSLATIIEAKLTSLGLASGGIHIRNSENNTKYPDGSLADYYGVIKRCKEYGIPGLIVEHAFVSNPGDAQKFLSTDAQLKKLGVADATGIAEYFGLKKGVGFISILASGSDSLELTWTKASESVTGYMIYRSTDKKDGFKKVATISSPSITNWKDTGLEPGVTYYYKIRTYTKSGSGNKYGSYSAVASGEIMGIPSIKSIKSSNDKKLVITWNAVDNADNYEIYRASSKDGKYSQRAMVSGEKTSYTDSGLKPGKLYYYKIRVMKKDGTATTYSEWCSSVSGRTAKKPSDLRISSRNSTTLRISWTPDKKAAGYIITRATSKTGKYKKVATVKGGSTKYYDNKKLKSGKTYYYKVETYNYNGKKKGYSGASEAVSGKTLAGTSITKIVPTSASKETISWKKIKEAKGYEIYQSTSKDGKYSKIKTISSNKTTSYKVTGLKAGTKYYYKVRTYIKVNGVKGYGDYSVVRGARVGKKPVITAEGTTGTKIKISWAAVKDAAGYDVYRSTSEKGTYSRIKTLKADAVSYTDSRLKMTKKYYYKVEAKMKGYKATGTAGMSKVAGAYPVRETQIVSVEANEEETLAVNWKKVKNITGYEVYRSEEEDGAYDLLETITDYSVDSYVDSTAGKSKIYWYKIRLVNTYEGKTIYGKYSGPVSGIILTAPASVTVTPVSAGQLDISWTAAENATGYILYRSMAQEGEYTEIARTASVTTYSDTTVAAGTVYYYKIKSLGADNKTSIFSAAASGRTMENQVP